MIALSWFLLMSALPAKRAPKPVTYHKAEVHHD